MTIHDLIESGYIELYVMNALPEEERIHLERMAASYPEVRAEIQKVEAALHALAFKQAVAPRPSLKAEILEHIGHTDTGTPLSEDFDAPGTSAVSAVKSTLRFAQVLPYMLAVLLGGLATYFYIHKNRIQAEQTACATSDKIKQEEITRLTHTVDMLRNPNTKFVELKGLKLSPQSKVMVYWNKVSKETYVNIGDLPQPPSDKQYQLWAIVNQKPVDAGVFDLDFQKIQRMKDFDSAEAFAVTLEPKGGSVNPTLDKMYAIGNL